MLTIFVDICEKIVIPNMTLRDEDVEIFEDDPVEYIRRDLEGSDNDTRRRASVELVKGLCMFHEDMVCLLVLY
jgi:exportin-2 (importin alpha re-exporter)